MDRGTFAVCANVHLEIVLHCLEKGSKMAVMLSVRECAGKAILHAKCIFCQKKRFINVFIFASPKQLRLYPSIHDALQKENVTVGDVIYIEAHSSAVKHMPPSSTSRQTTSKG
jgi:DNA helicase TIP49 (TBP-interacting protein)